MSDGGAVSSPLDRRRAGVLLHPTSLPGGGRLGPDAYRFVDFLVDAGFSLWQTLPLVPTDSDLSPYHGKSAHAGSERLICLEELVSSGWLEADSGPGEGEDGQSYLNRRLQAARKAFTASAPEEERNAYREYEEKHAYWLDDYALYVTLRHANGMQPWWSWPAELRDREPTALAAARLAHIEEVEQSRFNQFLFNRQWLRLKQYANERGVLIFGDIPLFVSADSADVWAGRDYFLLDREGNATVVAGVPPDYFSATGQRWGNPLFDWERMQADNFRWWVERIGSQLEQFDLLRIDHFRGLESYWEIPAREETAINGCWVPAPGGELLHTLHETFHRLPLVAEDLGCITPEVDALRERFHLPGMKILQFAFSGESGNPYLPHNHIEESVVYTGTHDNNTTVGWYSELTEEGRRHVQDYFACPPDDVPDAICRTALSSVAKLAMLPMQDLLGLGSKCRMNRPGQQNGNNWCWSFSWEQVGDGVCGRFRRLLELYGRT